MQKQLSVFATHGAESAPSFGQTAARRRLLRRLLRLRPLNGHAARSPRLGPCCSAVPDAPNELDALRAEASVCTRCRLHQGRTTVVFGSGDPNADLMFVGEAPGFHEDQQGVPFVGQAGKLLDRLLEGIGLTRADVYVANVLKCRPPGNRDPQPDEIEQCEP